MKTDLLASRHIGINEQDTAIMLRKIGVNSLDELINQTIPANIRLKEPLALTSPLTEYEFGKHIAELAAKKQTIYHIYRFGMVQHDHSGRYPAECIRKPSMVYFLHSVPDRGIARTSGSIDEFPDSRM